MTITKLKHSTKVSAEPRTSTGSRFFSSILITGAMLLFILKPGISKGNEAVKKEMQKILKEHPAKEWKVQEADKNEEKTYKLDWITPPDTTAIKSFFLDGGFLNNNEVKDFNAMRKESTKSPSRPAIYRTICDIRETSSNDYNKAIFTTSFLDPFQKTALGKSAFQAIDSEPGLKWSYSLCCKVYIQNIEIIKLEEKNKELDEVIKLLKQLEEVYKKYLNK